MKNLALAGLLTAGVVIAAAAQQAAAPNGVTRRTPDPAAPPAAAAAVPENLPPSGGTALMLRGLDKVTGRPTEILAPIGKPVHYATLTVTARFCYSTPASETPETTAFVQIDDHRPDQPERKVFSGWMYASSPGLNPMDHPTYDVWVIGCNNNHNATVTASAGTVKVLAPDSSDKEKVQELPAEAGQ